MHKHNILKELRKSKNLTKRQTAQILNISYRQYKIYENNIYKTKASDIIKIANFFNVISDYILSFRYIKKP